MQSCQKVNCFSLKNHKYVTAQFSWDVHPAYSENLVTFFSLTSYLNLFSFSVGCKWRMKHELKSMYLIKIQVVNIQVLMVLGNYWLFLWSMWLMYSFTDRFNFPSIFCDAVCHLKHYTKSKVIFCMISK